MRQKKKNLIGDVTVSEMKAFIGVHLLSEYVPLPHRKFFWQSEKDANKQLVCEVISRDRFNFIMSNFYVCDNDRLIKEDRYANTK